MINSTELRRITEDNDSTKIDQILAELEPMMLDRARRGESSLTIGLMPIHGITFGKSEPILERPAPDMIVARVIWALRHLGYKDEWVTSGDSYVPRGLQEDYEGNGPLYVNWVVRISW